jgi:hypothetical protein
VGGSSKETAAPRPASPPDAAPAAVVGTCQTAVDNMTRILRAQGQLSEGDLQQFHHEMLRQCLADPLGQECLDCITASPDYAAIERCVPICEPKP